ncbi:hypothetical protein L6452_30875 [Arctium lappa]|uniref:Uncharacterized protein n=1 Tax=Arctium lappa TaxID=4217 RepID=A0ACB8ZJK7_ARCLA|nr:hypothetical protein L6452_30875 [Arctium lappa]
MKVLKITKSSFKDFQGTSTSLSLKSVQSQPEESKSVSEVSSKSSVQRQSYLRTSESSSSEILVQSSEDDHSESLDKEEQMTRHLVIRFTF